MEFFKQDPKNGHQVVVFEKKEWEVVKRLGDQKTKEGFLMKVDIYKVKRKSGRKTIKAFAVITEMRTQKDEWHYWVDKISKSRLDIELALEETIRKVTRRFDVTEQYKEHLNKMKSSARKE